MGLLGWGRQNALAVIKQDKLESVVFQVNGKPRQIEDGGILKVVWGDAVEVEMAQLTDGRRQVEVINVVGFRGKPGSPDDRGYIIRTHADLNSDWAHDAGQQLYRVNIRSANQLYGRVYIQLHDPVLDYAVAWINGKSRKLKPGQAVTVRTTDQIQLDDIKANLDLQDPSFRYEIATTPGQSISHRHEIRFFRHGRLFATIPIVVDKP
jgi:hypothetical protein